jgi:hypothetical protein
MLVVRMEGGSFSLRKERVTLDGLVLEGRIIVKCILKEIQ